MKLFSSHMARWLPVILVIAGSLAMAAGIFSTSALAVSPADINLPTHAAVYVGAGTCYTCHTDDFGGWSVPVDLQALADAAAKPKQVVADVAAREEVEHVDVDEYADACLSLSNSVQLTDAGSRQYVVKTDKGESLLPLQWNERQPEAVPDQRSSEAIDCTVSRPKIGASSAPLIAQLERTHSNSSRLSWAHTQPNLRVTTLHLPSKTTFTEGPSA
jgi:hypothetical protein